ncbi:MAG TPA: ABC transporter ATP-binding protein [Clostridium sp.]|jgi:putative ABC transport system ATP-binding protein|uniref:ABC transporter ATP-binding protein n=1 Tax=uncultured Clostridium sp. TaxID=59620 RepID=UPI000E9B5550|nr:ABC transporter ATP-binding protein [uncultured Clostridium sp.]NLU07120.1 ABC transporter ATP-binding protein [Clostridiales bacterium]HBC96215.1 ABC transporter ATP-binding protein [Clostridium sp.]
MSFIDFENVKKEYTAGDVTIAAVKDCSFSIEKGQLVVILGPSGAGKTTVLNMLGGMDSPSGGRIVVDGNEVHNYTKKELVNYRRSDIGFVFQFYNLMENLTVLENVELACQICPDHVEPKTVLKRVGLSERVDNFPAQLSGGEQQRVAIARAIAKNPKLLLCDEPTGALDSVTGQRVIELLQNTCGQMGTTTVIITHNAAIAGIADKIIRIKNGTVEDVSTNKNPKKAKEIVW